MNNKISSVLMSLIALTLTIPAFSANPSITLAQIRGEDSQEFFGEGDQETNQEIQILEDEQSPESTEERAEQELVHPFIREGQNPDASEIEGIYSPEAVEGDNVGSSRLVIVNE